MSNNLDAHAADQRDAAMEQIKAVFEEGVGTINGRDYKFSITSHSQRVKVFAFFTKVRPMFEKNDMSFLDSKEFSDVEKVINNIVMFNGSLLSRLPTHWEEYPEDYLMFIPMAMGVICYPFLRGKRTA